MAAQLKTAVLGATGYAGFELTRLLLRHPRLQEPCLLQREDGGKTQDLAEAFPALSGNGGYALQPFSLDRLKQAGVDLLFLATPHELSRKLVPEVVRQGIRVIDLSGAWRLQKDEHRAVYGFQDRDASVANEVMKQAVYGLPELHQSEIAVAALVANPGCYATSVILGLGAADGSGSCGPAIAELSPIRSQEYPGRVRKPRTAPILFRWPTTCRPMACSSIAISGRCSSSWGWHRRS